MSKLDLFNGIVELAKAGYKPSDVKDLLESLKTDPDLDPKNGSDLKEETPEKKDPAPAPAPAPDDFDAIAEIINRNKGE